MKNKIRIFIIVIIIFSNIVFLLSCNDNINEINLCNFTDDITVNNYNENNDIKSFIIDDNTHLYVVDESNIDNLSYVKNVYMDDFLYYDRQMSFNEFINANPDYYWEMSKNFYNEYIDEFTKTTGINIVIKEYPDFFSIKERYNQILAGTSPDIIRIEKHQIPFYAHYSMIIPLDNLFQNSKSIINNENISQHYFNDSLYGFSISMKPFYLFIYSKEIIHNFGLNDPLDLWINDNWTWDTWLELILTINKEMQSYSFEPLGKSVYIENAFFISNDAKIIEFSDNGYFNYAVDERYINAMNFINDIYENYNIQNIKNVHARYIPANPEELIRNKTNFMTYDYIYQIFNKNLYNRPLYIADNEISFICTPRGPNSIKNLPSQNYGSVQCYSISSSCNDPDSTAIYIDWLLNDDGNYNDRKNHYINNLYGGSEELFEYGKIWSNNVNSLYGFVFMDSNSFFTEFYQTFDSINSSQLTENSTIQIMQNLIDSYLNIFMD